MSPSDKNRSKQERAALAEQMRKEREKAARRQRNVITVGIVVAVLIIGGLAAFAIKKTVNNNKLSDAPYSAPKGTSAKDLGILYDAKSAGATPTKTDPVAVKIYEDLQCPVCKAFYAANGTYLDGLVKNGDIAITYMPTAFLDAGSPDHYSTRALNAAACVLDSTDSGVFRKFTDLLYANQPTEGTKGLTNAQLTAFAKEAGAPGLATCIDKQNFHKWVDKVTAAFNKRPNGVSGTPTVFVAGKVVNGPKVNGNLTQPTQADIQKAIDAAAKA